MAEMAEKTAAMKRWNKACVKMADIRTKYSALQTEYYDLITSTISFDNDDSRLFREELWSEITRLRHEFWAAKAIVAEMQPEIEKVLGHVNSL